ncbi:MAG: DUF5686 family protein [Candidatus Azobacteroides sp.]|nr:DUF5686 family protein [Candidatus Azobacteroides sp.]
MNKKRKNIWWIIRKNVFILSAFFLCFSASLLAQDHSDKADSIMIKVLGIRDLYRKYIYEYEAEAYIKGSTHIVKRNLLYRYAPRFLYLNRKGHNMFVESIVDIHYTAPNYFAQQIKALNGNKLNADDIRKRVMPFLNVNIYNPTLFNDHVLFPGINRIFHYYRFEYIASSDTLGKTIHQIKIIPKMRSQKLISGFLYIVDGTWMIYRFDILGKWEFSKFRVQTEFGLQPDNFLLPLNSTVIFYMDLLGNETINYYFSNFKYRSVKSFQSQEKEAKVNYDVSDYFSVRVDSLPIIKDSLFWAENRPVPLSNYEKSLIEDSRKREREPDSTALNKPQFKYSSEGLIAPQSVKYNNTQFSYSGLLNPLKLAYSKLEGVMYWQQFKLHKDFASGKELQFSPQFGILFRRQELYFNLPAYWLFAPGKFGNISCSFGNRNRSYSSAIIDQINKETPVNIHFEDFNLEYYKHFYTELGIQYELTNGLLLYGGLNYDWYIPVKTGKEEMQFTGNYSNGDVIDLVQNRYRAFVPMIGLQWTPGQYYRINGKRKEYVGSSFPTFTLEYAKGIKNWFHSNSDYRRIEIDAQQRIPLGLMRSFQYYLGAGKFMQAKSIYFADFNHFQRRYIPQSWNDPIGGYFHLLRGDWYNAANAYIQVHCMYELPFGVLKFFRSVSRDILKERFYVAQLYTPALPCYTELGYGVGNFLGNIGFFVSFNRGKYESIGAKFAFELGR